jgi:hypothetical protein
MPAGRRTRLQPFITTVGKELFRGTYRLSHRPRSISPGPMAGRSRAARTYSAAVFSSTYSHACARDRIWCPRRGRRAGVTPRLDRRLARLSCCYGGWHGHVSRRARDSNETPSSFPSETPQDFVLIFTPRRRRTAPAQCRIIYNRARCAPRRPTTHPPASSSKKQSEPRV